MHIGAGQSREVVYRGVVTTRTARKSTCRVRGGLLSGVRGLLGLGDHNNGVWLLGLCYPLASGLVLFLLQLLADLVLMFVL